MAVQSERDYLVQARKLAAAEWDAFRRVNARSWGRTPTVAEHRAFVNARAEARAAYQAAVKALDEYDAQHAKED